MGKKKRSDLTGNEPKEYLIDIPSELIQQASESIDLLLSKLDRALSITEKTLLLRRNINKAFEPIEDVYTQTSNDGKVSLNTGLLSLSILSKDLRTGYYYQLLENIRNDEARWLTLEELAQAATTRLLNRRSTSNTDAQKETLVSIETELLSILTPES